MSKANTGSIPLVGLEEDVQVLSQMLMKDDDFGEVIFIVGSKGAGKTTLVNEVYKNMVNYPRFEVTIWVTVLEQMGNVLLDIVKQTPDQIITRRRKENMKDLEEKLVDVLSSSRCLIVFDDLNSLEAWKHIRDLLRRVYGESKIMVTTPRRDLAKIESNWVSTTYEMRRLSDAQSWELLNARVPVPPELKEVARDIMRKCMGLPLAILTAGEMLSRTPKDRGRWSEVLNQTHLQLDSRTSKATVDALPPNLKECISCFKLFHENYDVPKRRLFALWVAEELVQNETGSGESPEKHAEKCLMELVHEDFIQVAEWKTDGKVKTCRLNQTLRENWLSKEGGEASKNKKPERPVRLADHLDDKDDCFSHIHSSGRLSRSSLQDYYRYVRSFLSFDLREGPVPGVDIGNFLGKAIAMRCFKMLRVIDLESVFRPKLPNSIGNISQLRYLSLRGTYLEVLPSSIGNLLNLRTLDLKHTCIRRLPSSVWKMQQLQHLYLTEIYRCRFVAPPANSSLRNIQTLWGVFVDEETPFSDGLDRLVSLRKLGLACRFPLSEQKASQQRALAKWIVNLNNLESLRLRSIDEKAQPSDLDVEPLSGLKNLSNIYLFGELVNPVVNNYFPTSLTEIALSLSGLKEDPAPRLEKLPNLRTLNLYSRSYVGKKMVCSVGGFPLLQGLNLWMLEQLEEWIVEKGAMTILKKVEIRSCSKLKMIPDGFQHLVHCQQIKLTSMPDAFKERVSPNKGEDWHKIAHVPTIVVADWDKTARVPTNVVTYGGGAMYAPGDSIES
ncbi:hypothetical protein LguiB_031652 [Lonicera macranthoides]